MNEKNLQEILTKLPDHVVLVTVSKQHTKAEIDEAYRCGCRIFAENKVQELKQKYDPAYVWHMIGHLQRNKVKDVVPLVSMIQSVDSILLVEEIEKQCKKHDKVLPILIEINISQEQNKSGIKLHEAEAFVKACEAYPHVDVQGFMCVGPHVDERMIIEECFAQMHALLIQMQAKYGKDKITTLSMGMSDDYEIAIEQGSTMIRLGSLIMGNRTYEK